VERLYEGMFLVSPGVGEGDGALQPVRRVLDRAQAEVLVCKKWDERRLAYEIDKHRRGIYVLAYFRADGERIPDIERDVQLSEEILRVLVLRAEDVGKEEMEAPTPAESPRSPSDGDGDSADDRPRRSDDRPRRSDDRPRRSDDRPRRSDDRPRRTDDSPQRADD